MALLGFGRQQRLLTPQDFKRVFDQSKHKASDSKLLLLSSPNGLECSRIGFVISKRNVRRAVDRNRIRRVIRESFRLNQATPASFDVVIIARRGLDQLDNDALKALFEKLWQRLVTKFS